MDKEEIVAVVRPLLDEFKSQIIRELKDHIDSRLEGKNLQASSAERPCEYKPAPLSESMARWERDRAEREKADAILDEVVQSDWRDMKERAAVNTVLANYIRESDAKRRAR